MASATPLVLDRRAFLADMGRGAFAIAVLGIAGCSPSSLMTPGPTRAATTSGATPSPAGTGPAGSSAPPGGSSPPSSAAEAGVTWARVNLGFVSAYVLVRGGEAALVDTGEFDSSHEIEAALAGAGLGWDAVGHVILTHKHGDHVGSIGRVMELAPAATAYLGSDDLAALPNVPLTPLADGDNVFGLSIVGTPGHTPGSMSVLDPVAGVLVAGDAMGTDAGVPVLPGSRFTESMGQARESVVKLGTLTFETLLVGHGDPIESGASALVAELGAS